MDISNLHSAQWYLAVPRSHRDRSHESENLDNRSITLHLVFYSVCHHCSYFKREWGEKSQCLLWKKRYCSNLARHIAPHRLDVVNTETV